MRTKHRKLLSIAKGSTRNRIKKKRQKKKKKRKF